MAPPFFWYCCFTSPAGSRSGASASATAAGAAAGSRCGGPWCGGFGWLPGRDFRYCSTSRLHDQVERRADGGELPEGQQRAESGVPAQPQPPDETAEREEPQDAQPDIQRRARVRSAECAELVPGDEVGDHDRQCTDDHAEDGAADDEPGPVPPRRSGGGDEGKQEHQHRRRGVEPQQLRQLIDLLWARRVFLDAPFGGEVALPLGRAAVGRRRGPAGPPPGAAPYGFDSGGCGG